MIRALLVAVATAAAGVGAIAHAALTWTNDCGPLSAPPEPDVNGFWRRGSSSVVPG
ncbi:MULTISPECIES: hypothetical protein [Mycobacterium]|uniref:hypothetical protein n=1 Tax=Mycobacterium TaxID=1763 RepID=UPI000ACA2909|nr:MULTISPECIES: hypothetical protein [Mycobacterium]MDP7726781.1 hypothetical protein [Mycobacterium sp. TY813]